MGFIAAAWLPYLHGLSCKDLHGLSWRDSICPPWALSLTRSPRRHAFCINTLTDLRERLLPLRFGSLVHLNSLRQSQPTNESRLLIGPPLAAGLDWVRSLQDHVTLPPNDPLSYRCISAPDHLLLLTWLPPTLILGYEEVIQQFLERMSHSIQSDQFTNSLQSSSPSPCLSNLSFARYSISSPPHD